jgi:hypothetical protein
MFRKLFLLLLIFMFYFWITDSKENVEKFKTVYQYIAGKLNKIDLEFDFRSKSKDKKW